MNARFTSIALVLCFTLAGCSAGAPAAAEAPAPAPAAAGDNCSQHAASSPEHCECLGGYVKGDIGDGKVACTDGDIELERTQQGIEGAVCCKETETVAVQ